MSIHNAGTAIRLARKEAHLTQEKLSEGICTPSMLSQIEMAQEVFPLQPLKH